MEELSALFQQGNIGSLQLKNRIIMSAMGTILADAEGNVTDALIDYYRARARGGTGLIVIQGTIVSPDSSLPVNLFIYDDKYVPGFKRLVDAVHEEGAKISIQLVHFGLEFLAFTFLALGKPIIVPSVTGSLPKDRTYIVPTEEDIERYIEDFGEAARRVKDAGADAVELHACHGCLVSTFMSPVTNLRTDQYGGSKENRIRFPQRIVEAMRGKVGADFPITVRINATDDTDGGVTLEEAVYQAVVLESAGAHGISVSGGLGAFSPLNVPCFAYPEGATAHLAAEVKKSLKVPVIAGVKMNPQLASQLIGEGEVDFVAFGRPHFADPELSNKLRDGRLEELRWCLRCCNCLRLGPGMISCTMNPFLFRESGYPPPATEAPRKVMVIGGGIAGMQAALTAAQRGHEVSLYEKTHELGGQWNIAAHLLGKESYATFTQYLDRALKQLGVAVHLETEVAKEDILRMSPDAVIVATGALPMILNVPGATGPNVVQANDVIAGKAEAEGRVVVVGGGLLGMETALWLAEKGQEVSLISDIGLGGRKGVEEHFVFRTLFNRLVHARIPLYLHSPVVEITGQSVHMAVGDNVFSVAADTVVLAVGAQSVNQLAQDLNDTGIEIHVVGDCVEPRHASAATYEAAQAALQI
jgi:2,4-dienoyl-CoA reductase-like NADH-dependent reductase (Old Yellow Enzyme family)/thioredoxin reductase